MRIALGLEYDGADHHGWQSQADGSGVQDHVERALSRIAGMPVGVIAAGRTDSGVHASMQVLHFETSVERPQTAWVRGTNTLLPPTISVRWSRPVDAGFHARFSATGRHYTYLLVNEAVRPALLARKTGWYHRPLALAPMQDAASKLVGRHDFSAFRAAECQAKSPVKLLDRLDISHERNLLRFDFHADAFLHHMVRNIVGALIYVGNGRRPAQWMVDLLAGRDRTRAAPTFAAAGLYLEGVDYPSSFNLPPTLVPVRMLGA
jgi:tRNA pseudouridine38-40 synthase